MTSDDVVNIVTGSQLTKDSSDFLLHCLEMGEESYNQFYKTRLEEKSSKLFDVIPKTRKVIKTVKGNAKIDLNKETVTLLRYIDYARIRNYSIENLFQYELTSTSFFLFKDGFPRKPDKSALGKDLKKLVECPTKMPPPSCDQAVIIDFMGYARKVPTKKMNLKTFSDLAATLWSTFEGLSKSCSRTDIIFDLYFDNSIKGSERKRRSKIPGIYTTVSRGDQPLPIEFDKFWSLSSNKVSFQQFFIRWLTTNYKGTQIIFFGGSHMEDELACTRLENGSLHNELSLRCSHEEADDRIMYHLSHVVKSNHFQKIIVASPDTDVFVCVIHHFNQLIYFGLNELWFLTGKSISKCFIPIHDLVNTMDSDVIDILPAVHALTGCDTTSKVGTKASALKQASKCGYKLLYSFGKEDISDSMMSNAEKFLLKCLSSSDEIHHFDQLRNEIYHKKQNQFNIEKFPPSTSSIEQHIKRAYLQSYLWFHAPFVANITLDPLLFGYEFDEDGCLLPISVGQSKIPEDFPIPCSCIKCARANVCPCRVKNLACCKFCRCKSEEQCKNPSNTYVTL